jgi:hypothetical protein
VSKKCAEIGQKPGLTGPEIQLNLKRNVEKRFTSG